MAKLNDLVKQYWLKYCDIVRKRFEVEVRRIFLSNKNMCLEKIQLFVHHQFNLRELSFYFVKFNIIYSNLNVDRLIYLKKKS